MSNQVQLTPDVINKCETMLCECGHHFFIKKTLIKKVPSIMIGQHNFANLEISFCEKCGAEAGDNPIDYPGKPKHEEETAEENQSIIPETPAADENGGLKVV